MRGRSRSSRAPTGARWRRETPSALGRAGRSTSATRARRRASPAFPAPDAIFFGGGNSDATMQIALERLKPGGRLVAHSVTLESEAGLLAAYASHGGELGAPRVRACRAARKFLRLAAVDAGDAMGVEKAMSGRLYGIGVGPGDPELMTLKAVGLANAGHRLSPAATAPRSSAAERSESRGPRENISGPGSPLRSARE